MACRRRRVRTNPTNLCRRAQRIAQKSERPTDGTAAHGLASGDEFPMSMPTERRQKERASGAIQVGI